MIFPIITLLFNLIFLCPYIINFSIYLLTPLISIVLCGIVPLHLIKTYGINLKPYTGFHISGLILGFLLLGIVAEWLSDFMILIYMCIILAIISIAFDIFIVYIQPGDCKRKQRLELITAILSNPYMPISIWVVSMLIAIMTEGFHLF